MTLSFRQYQLQTERTKMQFRTEEEELVYLTLGLSGEVGEVTEVVKKVVYHGHKLDEAVIEKEIGDVLWYLARLCHVLGLDMEEVAEANIDKLRKRYPNGFSKADSVNRKE